MAFESRFPTEEACARYLFQTRWPQGFRCPACGASGGWRMGAGLLRCRTCRGRFSVTAGTLFHRSRKPLRTWFRVIWHVVHQVSGVSARELQRVAGLSTYATAWKWMHKLRAAMFPPGQDLLTGVVTVDEVFLSIRGDEEGRLVVVAAEGRGQRVGRVRLRCLPETTATALVEAVQQLVAPGSELHTDGLAAYRPLAAKGYRHVVVRPEGHLGDHVLPPVAGVAPRLKRFLTRLYTAAVAPHSHYLDAYLDEFAFRFNSRRDGSPEETFARLIRNAVSPHEQAEFAEDHAASSGLQGHSTR